jgi:hypothetical protein
MKSISQGRLNTYRQPSARYQKRLSIEILSQSVGSSAVFCVFISQQQHAHNQGSLMTE